jgi:uncharacterized protein YdbL (DUF1318 family)
MSTRIKIKPILRVLLIALTASMVGAISPVTLAQELSPDKPPRDRDSGAGRDDQDKSPDSGKRAELKKRFEERFERLTRWKEQARIGETFDGWIEALHEDLLTGEQRDVVAAENADRKALYALIAERVDESGEDKRVPPRIVAERNARRNFEKAEPDHLLKVSEGYWIAKRDLARASDITRLKRTGEIGETSDGLLGVVNTRPNDEVRALVDKENAARREIYREASRKLEKTSEDEVGRNAGKSTRDNLEPGQYYQSRNGDWEKRPTR